MKNVKRIFSIFLVILMVSAICVTNASALMWGCMHCGNTEPGADCPGCEYERLCSVCGNCNNCDSYAEVEYDEVEKGELDDEHKCEVYVTKGSSYTVQIPKVVILDGTDGIGEYAVTVAGDIDGERVVTVTPAATTMTLTQAGKDDITATIEQDKTAWAFDEMEVLGNGTITVDSDANGNSLLTAGSWTGSFMMEISYEDKAPDVKTMNIGTVSGQTWGSIQYEEDMTWRTWVNSPYNTHGFTVGYDSNSFETILHGNNAVLLANGATGLSPDSNVSDGALYYSY